jgi:fibronectin-binding autotransporter adhesin
MKPKFSSPVSVAKAASLAFVLFAMSAPQAFAQTWSGATNGNWATGTNWVGGVAPTGGAITITGSANPVMNNNISSLTTGNITFNATTAASFTLSGNNIVLGGNLTTTALTSGGPFTHTINIGMQLNGNRQFNAANSHSLILNGAITEDATPRSVTRGSGGGTIIWNGANTFTGGITLGGSGANTFSSISDTGSSSIGIGSAAITMTGANTQFSFIGTAPGATARNISIGTAGAAGDAATIFSSSTDAANTLTLSGNVSNSTSAKVFTLGGSNTGANLASGVISNGSAALSFNKTNPGTWTLSGANTFTGSAQVSGGILRVSTLGLADMNSGTTSNLGAGSAIVLTGGTLNFNNSGTNNNVVSNRNLDLRGNATISSDNGAGIDFTGGTFTASSSPTANRTLTLRGNSNQTNKIGLAISDVGSGFVTSVIKNDAGTWELSGANTHTGKTQILNGTLRVTTLGNVGSASSNLGAQTTAANATIDFGNAAVTGRLDYRGSGETTNRVVNLNGATGGGTISHEGSGVLRFTSDMTATGSGAKTLTLNGNGVTAGKRGEFAGVIADSSGGATTVTKADSGRWALQGTNTFTGNVNINNGFLEVTSIGNTGSLTSNLGAGTTIGFGQGTANGTLEYVGAGETTNRIVDLKTGDTGGGRIANNGSGALVFTANTAHSGTVSAKTLFLGGTSTGFTNEFNGVINDQTGAIAVGLTKEGASTWSLGGTNTYTGATTVSAGVLAVNGSLANTTTTVAGTLQGSGTIGGSVTIQDGGTLAPGNSIESLGVASVDFLAGSTYAYELNSAVLNGDLTYSTGTLDIASGIGPLGTTLTLTELFSGTLAVNSKLTLISYTGGWTSTELFNYLGSTLADDSTFTLGSNQWLFNYDDTSGGSNFITDQAGAARFVTMTVVIPEPTAALLGGLGLLTMLRRRRK